MNTALQELYLSRVSKRAAKSLCTQHTPSERYLYKQINHNLYLKTKVMFCKDFT